jgi:hypothetical protein
MGERGGTWKSVEERGRAWRNVGEPKTFSTERSTFPLSAQRGGPKSKSGVSGTLRIVHEGRGGQKRSWESVGERMKAWKSAGERQTLSVKRSLEGLERSKKFAWGRWGGTKSNSGVSGYPVSHRRAHRSVGEHMRAWESI